MSRGLKSPGDRHVYTGKASLCHGLALASIFSSTSSHTHTHTGKARLCHGLALASIFNFIFYLSHTHTLPTAPRSSSPAQTMLTAGLFLFPIYGDVTKSGRLSLLFSPCALLAFHTLPFVPASRWVRRVCVHCPWTRFHESGHCLCPLGPGAPQRMKGGGARERALSSSEEGGNGHPGWV